MFPYQTKSFPFALQLQPNRHRIPEKSTSTLPTFPQNLNEPAHAPESHSNDTLHPHREIIAITRHEVQDTSTATFRKRGTLFPAGPSRAVSLIFRIFPVRGVTIVLRAWNSFARFRRACCVAETRLAASLDGLFPVFVMQTLARRRRRTIEVRGRRKERTKAEGEAAEQASQQASQTRGVFASFASSHRSALPLSLPPLSLFSLPGHHFASFHIHTRVFLRPLATSSESLGSVSHAFLSSRSCSSHPAHSHEASGSGEYACEASFSWPDARSAVLVAPNNRWPPNLVSL